MSSTSFSPSPSDALIFSRIICFWYVNSCRHAGSSTDTNNLPWSSLMTRVCAAISGPTSSGHVTVTPASLILRARPKVAKRPRMRSPIVDGFDKTCPQRSNAIRRRRIALSLQFTRRSRDQQLLFPSGRFCNTMNLNALQTRKRRGCPRLITEISMIQSARRSGITRQRYFSFSGSSAARTRPAEIDVASSNTTSPASKFLSMSIT